jgi:hypothetical protein
MCSECPHTDKKAYCRKRCVGCYQIWKNRRPHVIENKKVKKARKNNKEVFEYLNIILN